MVAISQSGESTDTIEAVEYGKQRGIHVIGVTAAANSALYRLADATILLDVPRENAIAATVSMTTTVLALQMLLARFAGTEYESRQGIGDELQSLIASQSERGSALHSLRLLLEPAQYIAVLGGGPYVGVAREVALKIRETTGVIAEGMNAREYRHGPMEVLASPRLAATAVRRALILFESELVKAEAVLGFYGGLERKYRGTPYEFTLIRVGVGRAATGHDVVLPGVGAFNPNLAVVFCGQLVAYELALRHGIVPGTSEVLSKVVVGT
jgi:glucosamine 6-phosphate synthetase-like amidotransferase/phosphosugar isomerase protein